MGLMREWARFIKKTINNPIIFPINRRELHRDSKVMGEIVWVGKWRSKVVVNCVQMIFKHETVRFFLSLNFWFFLSFSKMNANKNSNGLSACMRVALWPTQTDRPTQPTYPTVHPFMLVYSFRWKWNWGLNAMRHMIWHGLNWVNVCDICSIVYMYNVHVQVVYVCVC